MSRSGGSGAPRAREDAAWRLAGLWDYLSSWLAADGGVNGPIVHRSDLKRMFSIHDTAWTQQAAISGLVELYRRSGTDHWLSRALHLADAQCARLQPDGRFRWAGHEDDRFSALISNALADCALLDLCTVLADSGERERRERYLDVVERNLRSYVIERLYSDELRGFRMNPVDYYAGRDRFIVNMNSVAIEALIRLDRERSTHGAARFADAVGERILSLQTREGRARGGLPYSDLAPNTHVSLYTGLSIRGLVWLKHLTGDEAWTRLAGECADWLETVRDDDTGLWCHKIENDVVCRFPIFVAGAGMICNGLLDAAAMTGRSVDGHALAGLLLRHQYRNGAIRNFIGYDHRDNGRRRARGLECWEDVYPTPGWNAQAFHFLCRVLPPPEPRESPDARWAVAGSRRYVYFETRRLSAVLGLWPPARGLAGLFVKRWRYGLVLPGRDMIARAVRRLSRRPRRRGGAWST